MPNAFNLTLLAASVAYSSHLVEETLFKRFWIAQASSRDGPQEAYNNYRRGLPKFEMSLPINIQSFHWSKLVLTSI